MATTHCHRRIQGHRGLRPVTPCVSQLGSHPHEVKHPIGVFDSGIGGLSILKALRSELPFEDFVYVADSGHAPYGERDDAYVISRSRAITTYLQTQHHIKALVIACNTATAAAIHLLRQEHPSLPIIGVEPALKPAVAQSQTRRIGVMATRGTLGSAKFRSLMDSLASQADLVCQPCSGLAHAIECADATKIIALCAEYTRAMGPFGTESGQIDTLVLGCTHYPFVSPVLRDLVGPNVCLIDNGEPVARQTRRKLPAQAPETHAGQCLLLSTGDCTFLQLAARQWLALDGPVEPLSI
jgi:glutamate racemase